MKLTTFLFLAFLALSSVGHAKAYPVPSEIKEALESIQGVKRVMTRGGSSKSWTMWVSTEPVMLKVSIRNKKEIEMVVYWWKNERNETGEAGAKIFSEKIHKKLTNLNPKFEVPVLMLEGYLTNPGEPEPKGYPRKLEL